MGLNLGSRLQHAWNAFTNNRDPTMSYYHYGASSYYRPDRPRLSGGNERTIATSVLNRIAVDASSIDIMHAKLDKDDRFVEMMDSGLNTCLTLEANIDQSARAFRHDIFLSMLNEGCVAIVPIETDIALNESGSFDILNMRTGKIVEWYPEHVKVEVYNERKGRKENITLPKRSVAIVENPFRAVMNEPNSTLQRLIRKLSLLDIFDEKSGSGKLDLIIQLPFSVRGELKRQQAKQRLDDLENQIANSPHGIAYADATERITQLNRPVENNLLKQIEYLTNLLYSQLGITQSIMDGTADEKTMLNYYSRTIEPMVSAVVDEMKRTFLTKTARTRKQSVVFFRDPFKLVPATELAEIADKMTRNEIMTSNEIRQEMGLKPSSDPSADELRNKNLNKSDNETVTPSVEEKVNKIIDKEESQNGV